MSEAPSVAPRPIIAPRTAYLHPGQIGAFAEPTMITTILGSCVATCLFDPDGAIGGMNHFILPESAPGHSDSPRFAKPAFDRLLGRLLDLGARRARLRAKVFGGASVLPGSQAAREGQLGRRNSDLALRLLEDAQIAVIGENVGGSRGRKLVFHTDTGAAWVKEL